MPDIEATWDFQNPAQSERAFREFLDEARLTHSERIEIQTQIARALGLQRRFDVAQEVLDELPTPSSLYRLPTARTRYLLEQGRLLNSRGDQEASRTWFAQAFETAEAAKLEFLQIDAAHMLGIVEPGEVGLRWNIRAIALAENATSEKARNWLGSLYNNTGWSLHDMGQFENALEMFEKALNFSIGQGREVRTRIAKWTVARCLRSLGRVEDAYDRQKALLKEWQQAREESGYVYEELGECALLLGATQTAPGYFAEAYRILSQDAWLVANEPKRVARLERLSSAPANPGR